jgi:hypothetical protein
MAIDGSQTLTSKALDRLAVASPIAVPAFGGIVGRYVM